MSTTEKCLMETSDYSAEDARFMEMAINFDDSFIYDRTFMRSDALRAFRKWDAKEDKTKY
jgi:hypothetical protein